MPGVQQIPRPKRLACSVPIRFGVLGLVNALERKAQAALVRVNADDAQRYLQAFFDDFFRVIDASIRKLGNVNQALDLVIALDARECAELGKLGDRAFDELADLVAVLNGAPGSASRRLSERPMRLRS